MTDKSKQPARRLCMVPGPVEVSDDVAHALGDPTAQSHLDPDFIERYGAAISSLRVAFAASPATQPFVISGSGVLGWDMVAANLRPRAAVVCVAGVFGTRFADCLRAYNTSVIEVEAKSTGSAPQAEDLTTAIQAAQRELVDKDDVLVVTITHVDTSTGVRSNVKRLAAIARSTCPDAVIVVDAVCSAGGEELLMEAWDLDVVLTASQKALGAPPGLCVLLAGPRALDVAQRKLDAVGKSAATYMYYCSWAHWRPIMQAYEARKPAYFATPNVPCVRALHRSLQTLTASPNGVQDAVLAHAAAAAKVRKALLDDPAKLTLVPQTEDSLANTLTVVRLPDSAPQDALPRLLAAATKRGIVIAGGLAPGIASRSFRVGHMGVTATDPQSKNLDTTITAIKESLREIGL